jgi:hypothetical protein
VWLVNCLGLKKDRGQEDYLSHKDAVRDQTFLKYLEKWNVRYFDTTRYKRVLIYLFHFFRQKKATNEYPFPGVNRTPKELFPAAWTLLYDCADLYGIPHATLVKIMESKILKEGQGVPEEHEVKP